MKRYWFAVIMALLFLGHSAWAGDKEVVRLGILPTFDEGGESFAPVFSQYLTMMMFHDLEQQRGLSPVLLNPGGVYTPSSDEWIADYAQRADVDEVLVTVLQKQEASKQGELTITVRSEMINLASGKRSAAWMQSATIEKRNAVLQYGLDTYFHDIAFIEPSRAFEKQPLGKRARAIADAIALDVPSRITAQANRPAPSAAESGPCAVTFKIKYSSKNAASHAYSVIVNGKDDSLDIKDEGLPLNLKSGPLLIQAAVQDAPYKLPKQPIYQANTYLNCSEAHHDLLLDIGAAGEGLLKWQ